MKFPKGTIKEIAETSEAVRAETIRKEAESPRINATLSKQGPAGPSIAVEKDRLFETLDKEALSDRNYLRIIGLLGIAAAVGLAVLWYLMQPSFGDRIKGPPGLEAALREHIATVNKRESADIEFYNCGERVWASVDVVVRRDIKTDPVYQIGRYTAWADEVQGEWKITTAPAAGESVPCR